MSVSFHCPLCDRPMPPHIYKFHLKKSHTPEEQIKVNEKEIQKLGEISGTETPTTTPIEDIKVSNKDVFLDEVLKERIDKQFDWGEVYHCANCGMEYPAKAMPFHSWVKHRV